MAFFKFRKGGDEPKAAAAPSESIEALRRRARHRLIGAAVLVLAGIVGFPVLFDTQPRPIDVDIPIEIPDRNKVRPLAPPAPVAAAPTVAPPPAQAAAPAPAVPAETPKFEEKVAATPAQPASAAIKTEAKPAPVVTAKAETPKAEAKPEAKPEPKPLAPKPDDGAKARALLEGKPLEAVAQGAPAAAEGRFIVQVGAFADVAKARETRQKVERAGLKTYTHVAETKEGRRIRVRVGPFANRAEADKAAEKIKGLDLPAAILTL
jgi:DedD protein